MYFGAPYYFFVFLSFEVICTYMFSIFPSIIEGTENHDMETQAKEEEIC